MGVYVKFPDGSMHWDESLPDPNDNGGSVLDAATGQPIPGANRQSGSTGPGGNGVKGSQANPNGDYHAGPPVNGGVFGAGGFWGGPNRPANFRPLGQPGDFSATPFANWLLAYQRSQNPNIGLSQTPGPGGLQDSVSAVTPQDPNAQYQPYGFNPYDAMNDEFARRSR